jgi:predicted glutamine amidotransferase
MCGIVGMFKVGNAEISDFGRAIFTQLLIADSLRGTDGTGIITITKEGQYRTLKLNSDPFGLFYTKEYEKLIEKVKKLKLHALVGHNRYATTGKCTTANTHPFVKDHIVMVHNGTLEYSSDLELNKFDVDSQCLTEAVAQFGIKEAIAKVRGAYAVVFYDSKEHTLNFLRNHERPLALAIDTQMNTMYWASEGDMLRWILNRNSMKMVKVQELPVNELWSFDLKGDTLDPKKETMEGKASYIYVSGDSGCQGAFYDSDGIMWGGSRSTATVKTGSGADSFGRKLTLVGGKKNSVLDRRDPRLRECYISKKHYVAADSIGKYAKGSRIKVNVYDYVAEDPRNERYIVWAGTDEIPRARFQFRVIGDTVIDEVFSACSVEAKIRNIQLNKEIEKLNEEHIVWVSDFTYVLPKERVL